jgi:hypothetical protein
MRDNLRPATVAEEEDFANRWGIYANELVDDRAHPASPSEEGLDEVRWGDSKTLQFVFAAPGTAVQTIPQIIDLTRPARVWSIHLAMTLLTPTLLPGADVINAFMKISTGVGSSVINFSRTLQGTTFVINPFDPTSQSTTDTIVSDVPARKILVAAFVLYQAAAPVTVNVRIDAAASPVLR